MEHYSTILSVTTVPRQSIVATKHGHIDASLKELRTVSRRLTAFSSSFSNELRVLERIYYKGKNQHRSALFWQKVVEVRRFGARINDADMLGLVEGLRCSFHASEAGNAKRSAWIHTPDMQACKDVLTRLRSVCLLMDQARRRFLLAYQSFTQQLRTAAFLPLAVSLTAITSRLDFLLLDLRGIMTLLWEAVTRILESNPGFKPKLELNLRLPAASSHSGPEFNTKSYQSGKKSRLSVTRESVDDLGSRVVREITPHLMSPVTYDKSPGPGSGRELSTEFIPALVQSGNSPDDSMQIPDTETSLVPERIHHDTDIRTVTRARQSTIEPLTLVSSSGDHNPVSNAIVHEQRPLVEGKKQKVKPKVKRKRDEIDDIFGL